MQKLIKCIEVGMPIADNTSNSVENFNVILYVHKTSHAFKKVADQYKINVVFSAPKKMSKICGIVERHRKVQV